MAAEVKRASRVAEGVREAVAELLVRKIRDPRVAGAVVSRVQMTDDLRNARVYVRLLAGGEDPAARALLLKGLTSAAGMMRAHVTKSLSLRVAPELKFFYDDGLDRSTRVAELLDKISLEEKGKR